MDKIRVLYITNGHPRFYVGGVEVYSYELYKAMQETDEFEPILLARTISAGHRSGRDTPFRSAGDDPNQILWHSENHDYFFMTSPRKEDYTVHFHNFLAAYRPNIVHIQHTLGLGFDLIRQIRNSLPGTPIVYTLHEFFPICHAQGLMLRTFGGELCREASPTRCHECFEDIPAQKFFLRERFIKSHLRLVDLFLGPSHYLIDRFLDWGIPREKISFLEYGRILRQPAVGASADDAPPIGNIGLFGQLSQHKGVLVLLKAIKLLLDAGNRDIHLFLNGANLEIQSREFQKAVAKLLEECSDSVTFLGKYDSADLDDRMRDIAWVVVPSLWWENSPLVIQEAFMYGRPVICSDIGGMAEKVTDGVNSFHFRVGDATDLARTLQRATSSPSQWKKLRAGIPPIYSIEEAVEAHGSLYRSLLEKAGPRP